MARKPIGNEPPERSLAELVAESRRLAEATEASVRKLKEITAAMEAELAASAARRARKQES